MSSWFLFAAAAQGVYGLRTQIKRSDAENTVRLGIGDVDNSKVPPRPRLANSYSGPIMSRSILERSSKDVLRLVLLHAVASDMRVARLRIDIESDIHW